MTLFSRRLPHILTRADVSLLLLPTYTAAVNVDDDEAQERLDKAFAQPTLLEDVHQSVSVALLAAQGDRTEDQVIDKLSKNIAKRRGKLKPLENTPGVTTVMVRINVTLGLAPDVMRATLETDKGRALLKSGWQAIGDYLVRELLR